MSFILMKQQWHSWINIDKKNNIKTEYQISKRLKKTNIWTFSDIRKSQRLFVRKKGKIIFHGYRYTSTILKPGYSLIIQYKNRHLQQKNARNPVRFGWYIEVVIDTSQRFQSAASSVSLQCRPLQEIFHSTATMIYNSLVNHLLINFEFKNVLLSFLLGCPMPHAASQSSAILEKKKCKKINNIYIYSHTFSFNQFALFS